MKTIALELNTFPLTALMDNSQDSWGIKDRHSRFIYANSVFLDCFNLPREGNIIGKRDDELLTNKLAAIFSQQEKAVIKRGQKLTLIKIHGQGDEKKDYPYLYEIFPLYNQENTCVGTVFYGKKLALLSLSHNGEAFISPLLVDPPSDIFTQSELTIIFYLLHTLNTREIAIKLHRSPRTIENRIRIIYQKAKVNSLREFKTFCHQTGFERYFPQDVIAREIQCIEERRSHDE